MTTRIGNTPKDSEAQKLFFHKVVTKIPGFN